MIFGQNLKKKPFWYQMESTLIFDSIHSFVYSFQLILGRKCSKRLAHNKLYTIILTLDPKKVLKSGCCFVRDAKNRS